MSNGMNLRINIQTHDLAQAEKAHLKYGEQICIGVLARDFSQISEGVELVRKMQDRGILVSVGLGDGSADQWRRSLDIARQTMPFHLNQVFSSAALSNALLKDAGAKTRVNALVSPTNDANRLAVGTGPLSHKSSDSSLEIKVVLDLLLESEVHSLKLYPLKGIQNRETLRNVARAVGERKMTLEPTGGIDINNLEEILEICLQEGCELLMPHIYSSIKDAQGNIDFAKLDYAFEILNKVSG